MAFQQGRSRRKESRGRKSVGLIAAMAAFATAGSASSAVYVVDHASDGGDLDPADGICSTSTGTCTLRAAIQQANQNPGHDVVELPAGVYSIGIGGQFEDAGATGDFDITDSLTIQGAGIPSSIVDAQHLDRVFDIHPGTGPVAFERMTIRHGFVLMEGDLFELSYDDEYAGGGIRAFGEDVTLDGILLTRNDANDGGGLAADNGVTVLRSRIHQNDAFRSGGGLFTKSFDASLVFEDSVLWSNVAGVWGGGMKGVGDATFRRSAFFGNQAGEHGGGFQSNTGYIPEHAWNFENVTFAGNQAGQSGGAISVAGSFYARNVTIASNYAGFSGGGLHSFSVVVDDDLVHVENSILAHNVAPTGPDCRGAIQSEGFNLVNDRSDCGWTAAPTDLPDGTNPLLGSLQFLQTHFFPISHSSPAKDASPTCANEDQRGIARQQGAACDLGAYELEFDPEAPVAIDDHYQSSTPGPVTVPAPGLLANDSDPNGDPLAAKLQAVAPTQGSATVNADGSFTFVPAGLNAATRTFTYRATDGTNESNTATVSITSGRIDPPWTLFEVPELPWLDPGPYRFDCLALWDDGTIATQAFGAGEWHTQRRSRATRESETTTIEAQLTGSASRAVYDIEATFDDRSLQASLVGPDGERFEVRGYENERCNVLLDAEIEGGKR